MKQTSAKNQELRFVVVIYDISDNKTRTRLYKTLKLYGEAVQFSMFECLLDAPRLQQLRRAVALAAPDDRPNIRFYDLCRKCRRQTLTLGQARTTHTAPLAYIL